jgi:type IX secretion system PorP/SprF family membrane protein
MMKKILLAVGVTMVLNSAIAQDIHFTQYFTSPLTLNPALTGLIPEDLRLAGNYRTQWSSVVAAAPYTTATFSFDAAMFKNRLPDADALGIGLVGEYDKAGSGGLTNTTVGGSLAYHKGFGRDRQSHLSIGVQAVMVSKSVDFTKLTFEDQYDLSTAILVNSTSSQPHTTSAINYMDFNGGVMYSGKVTDHTTAYIGYSYYHLTQPVEDFTGVDASSKIHPRQSFYMGGSYELNDKVVLYASSLYQSQADAHEVLLGAAAGFVLNPGHDQEYQKNTTFYIGGWYRYLDAVCPYVGLEWSHMRLGISYDINVSNFSPATGGNGGYELSLLFFGKVNKHERNPSYDWSCPKVF